VTDGGVEGGSEAIGSEADEGHAARPVKTAIEWAAIIIGAFVAALIIKTFLFQAFFIPSASMDPTLEINDRVLVNKLSYRLHDVHRGDIVVFHRPPGAGGDPEINDLIKRVVALEGEQIETVDGRVVVDEEVLDEPYLAEGTDTTGIDPVRVPAGHVFVLGDNRSDSRDSRVFGTIDEDLIIGRAFVRVWPLGDFTFF
jgi:signal peptidase I